ncbi:MAG: hypothetical protein UV71_C0003G0062 [Microgenomates group bacterium GW2011_GWC1_43_13]|uniref:DUF5667 domain-containing protein n=3 Tax=Candidatus Woeseibacteriota TaxID=1752722 RepID=A0A837IDP1_9BACT|nr:MAG: hypothetical protein UV71_C0003G0062 [Microgenomates group bacterium GW2011_GWC1_43_13]KKT33444.1 MAG: hypothetical protein UW20_C0002G0035 [Candidatus Woesebacteria bacterium GW2011_GWB1_44_11]KKT54869.1 MAG: hypothetical protein UW47_C0002G0053 [Candidatus Woesebacteria bacterium GW2011_GWA1_44_23]OGM76028.1 MAG: hypothetical protein A2208_03055 [Candidatus Woesebacteria bacterium RIFOXYA1_FULL_43_16]OGM81986.1 MAG: hypothetical protein A2394_03220 [Candidatus Woesebacteria bacterium 
MLKKILLNLSVSVFAFAILSISILQSTSIYYSFTAQISQPSVLGAEAPEINYQMPYQGKVLPDNPLWVFKAARDKLWYLITSSPLKKAELALLFSDKRLVSAQTLFEKKKPDIAISTLAKGEKYLEVAVAQEAIARSQGYDTSTFLERLAVASLKHRQMIMGLIPLVPDDGKPFVIKTEDYSKNSYKAAKEALNSRGLPAPIDPFNGD